MMWLISEEEQNPVSIYNSWALARSILAFRKIMYCGLCTRPRCLCLWEREVLQLLEWHGANGCGGDSRVEHRRWIIGLCGWVDLLLASSELFLI
jgi:hypothetical protein